MMPSSNTRPNEGPAPDRPGDRPELAEAEALAAEGRFLAAIDVLTAANRRHRDAAIEERLVSLRYEAIAEVGSSPSRTPWPPTYPDPFPEVQGQPPEVPADQLETAVMGGAILNHGCLAVRGLLDPVVVRQLVGEIDDAIATVERWKDDPSVRSRHYLPFDPGGGNSLRELRAFVARHNCVLVNDAP